MSPDIFAEWLRRRGFQVFHTPSSYWFNLGPRVFQAFPYHWIISPPAAELRALFFDHSAIAVRHSTLLEAPLGAISYHVVYTEAMYPISRLPKKARHDVQKGLATIQIEPISFSRLANDGWQLRADTLDRQRRQNAETQSSWQMLCRSAEGLPGFEAWAAILNGQLAASLIAFTCGDCCSILYQQSRTEHLPLGVNNALAFVFTNEILKRPGNLWLFYGLHSLDAPPSVDEFKFRMGYVIKPVRQRVMFHPWLSPLINPASHAGLSVLKRMMPGNPVLTKAEGMLRFYLQGRLPLIKQSWPDVLKETRAGFLRSDTGDSS